MRSLLRCLLLLVAASSGASCGGGGGGDEPAPCTRPGTLRALAVQGQPAPGTAGAYAAFDPGMLMDCAAGGWSAFACATTDATRSQGVFVAQPDATVVLVFHVGESLPAGTAGGGTIGGFTGVRVNAAGQLLALVAVTGNTGGRTFALLSSSVSGGVVGTKRVVLLHQQDTASSGSSGVLASLDTGRLWLLADGRAVAGGVTSDSTEAVWIVGLDGNGLDSLVATGDTLPDGSLAVTCNDLRAFGISADGGRFAFVADVGGLYEDRLYIGAPSISSYAEVASDGNALPGGGNVLEVHGGGPLLVYDDGRVVWKAQGNGSVPDDVILVGSSSVAYTRLARSGLAAPGGGAYGELDMLACAPQCEYPQAVGERLGLGSSSDRATYAFSATQPLLGLYEGRSAPSDYGAATTFTDQFPGLRAPQCTDVSQDGAMACAALMADGSSGMFWIVPSCGLFTLAGSGQAVPGMADTFGAFAPQATRTVATGVVLFRAALQVAGSGLFRHGP
ncbi:MAG: hypothetical protein ACKOCB_04765 [Planctomycetia bacterium]